MSLILVVLGFFLLVKGADVFVDSASRMAGRLGISPLVTGLTIVALGTSAPEAAISISSSLQAADELAIANVLGSNIINTLVILGAVALVSRVPVGAETVRMDLPLIMGSTAMLLGLCLHDGVLGRADALLLLAVLATYLWYVVRMARGKKVAAVEGTGVLLGKQAGVAVAGALAIAAGAFVAVRGATDLAQALGLSERLVGLTVVALGTSLPELVTSVTAARKGQTEVALGNVVGSCMLNLLFVLGLSALIAPVPFAASMLADGLAALGAVVLVWVLCLHRRELGRGSGAVLLFSYATYLGFALMG